MRKLTIHKELFKTGQRGFAGSCTVVNIIQFHKDPCSGIQDSPGFWILDPTPWILVHVLDSGCFVSGSGIPDSNR